MNFLSGHPVDYPGQLAPVPVLPVVVQQLGQDGHYQGGQHHTHYLEKEIQSSN